eukprot:358703-Chlamydomonas_euryale.AAC.2
MEPIQQFLDQKLNGANRFFSLWPYAMRHALLACHAASVCRCALRYVVNMACICHLHWYLQSNASCDTKL